MLLNRKSIYPIQKANLSVVLISFTRAPPRLSMQISQTRAFAIPKAPSSIRPSKVVSNAPVRTFPPASSQNMPPRQGPQVNPTQMAMNSPKASVPPSTNGTNGSANPPTKAASQVEPKPTPSTPQEIQEPILAYGACEIIDEARNSSLAAKFLIKAHMPKNEGWFVVVPSGKSQAIHNVLSLGAPVIQGPFCLIVNAKREPLYKMKFQTSAAAENFLHMLKTLQESALLTGVPPKATPNVAASKEQVTSPPQTPSEETIKAEDTAPKAVNGGISSATQTTIPTEASPQQEFEEESLLDLDYDTTPKPAVTIEAAADHMQNIVQQILSEITATGVKVTEKGVEEIESTAIDNWMAQGFMQSATESDDLKNELVELLRLLVKIKRKVQFRNGTNPIPISSKTMQELQEIVEKPSKRIKYTTADIKELEAHAVSRPSEIEASGVQQIRKGTDTRVQPKQTVVPSMAKHRE